MGDIFLYKEAEHYINTLNGILNEDNVEFEIGRASCRERV